MTHGFSRQQIDEAIDACAIAYDGNGVLYAPARHSELIEPAWMARLELKGTQPNYLAYVGTEADCKAAAQYWPGARTRRNGDNGCWLIIVPMPVMNVAQPSIQPIAA